MISMTRPGLAVPLLWTDDDLRTIVEAETYSTTREMASKLGMSQHTVVDGLKKLGKVQ